MGLSNTLKVIGAAAGLTLAGCSDKSQSAVTPVPTVSSVGLSVLDKLEIGVEAAAATAEYAMNGGLARDGREVSGALSDSYNSREYVRIMRQGAGIPPDPTNKIPPK